METDNYYIQNEETGKLNVFTTKAYYAALEQEQKKVFTHFCLWSNRQQCWVSKGKAENCSYLKQQLQDLQFTDKGSTGKTLSFEEQVTKEKQNAVAKAERAEILAEKADRRSDELYNSAKDMASVIPFGQPILVGHHSEKRDRNYRAKIDAKFGKAFAEQDKAAYYTNKAEEAKATAEGKKYSNPVYLSKRIKECEKNIRVYERRLKGKFYTYSPEREISEESRAFYTGKLTQEQDKLGYYKKCIEALPLENMSDAKTTLKKNQKGNGI